MAALISTVYCIYWIYIPIFSSLFVAKFSINPAYIYIYIYIYIFRIVQWHYKFTPKVDEKCTSFPCYERLIELVDKKHWVVYNETSLIMINELIWISINDYETSLKRLSIKSIFLTNKNKADIFECILNCWIYSACSQGRSTKCCAPVTQPRGWAPHNTTPHQSY